jgi:hypothetical protein
MEQFVPFSSSSYSEIKHSFITSILLRFLFDNIHHFIPLRIYQEEFEDTKGVIRISISKKNGQHNGQKKKYKREIKHSFITSILLRFLFDNIHDLSLGL